MNTNEKKTPAEGENAEPVRVGNDVRIGEFTIGGNVPRYDDGACYDDGSVYGSNEAAEKAPEESAPPAAPKWGEFKWGDGSRWG